VVLKVPRLTNNDDGPHGVVGHELEDGRQEQQHAHHNHAGHKASQGCPGSTAIVDGAAAEATGCGVAAGQQRQKQRQHNTGKEVRSFTTGLQAGVLCLEQPNSAGKGITLQLQATQLKTRYGQAHRVTF
jgi:hypothetical protein